MKDLVRLATGERSRRVSSGNRLGSSDQPRTITTSVIPQDGARASTTGNEVEFALVLARMIDSVKHDPVQLREAIYELARHKLEEQFMDADAGEIQRTKNALEVAIRGVEVFFKKDEQVDKLLQQAAGHPPTIPTNVDYSSKLITHSPPKDPASGYQSEVISSVSSSETGKTFATPFRLLAVIAVFSVLLVAVQQRATLSLLLHNARVDDPSSTSVSLKIPPAPTDTSQSQAMVPKLSPLLPTTYGIYAVSDGKLFELKLLPGRAPDMRVAISAAIESPSQATLPSGRVKFIVFRRESGSSNPERAEVRLVAKITRSLSYDGEGKPNISDEDKWVIRNIAIAYRVAPIKDSPEMEEIASEDPEAELSSGRYALILKNQAYDFSIAGPLTDPRHCLERLTASNGTFYSQCSLRPSINR
jgi:hypothetical protein